MANATNFVKTIRKAAKTQKNVNVIDDYMISERQRQRSGEEKLRGYQWDTKRKQSRYS